MKIAEELSEKMISCYRYIYPSSQIYLSILPSILLSIYLFIYQDISIYPSIYLVIYLSIHISRYIYLSIHLSRYIYLSCYLSVPGLTICLEDLGWWAGGNQYYWLIGDLILYHMWLLSYTVYLYTIRSVLYTVLI